MVIGINNNSKRIIYEHRIDKNHKLIVYEKKEKIKNNRAEEELENISISVKNHELTHLLALGPYAASSIQYDSITTDDGKTYLTGGSIKVDLSPIVGNPEETLRKANAIINASLSVNNPSSADINTANKALLLASQAKREIDNKLLAKDDNNISLISMEDVKILYKNNILKEILKQQNLSINLLI